MQTARSLNYQLYEYDEIADLFPGLYNKSCRRYISKVLCFWTASNFLYSHRVELLACPTAAVLAHTISQSVCWPPVWEVSCPTGQNLAEIVSGGVTSPLQEVKEKDTLTIDGRVEVRKEPRRQMG